MPIHIAITRRVRPGCEAEFQAALREFFQTSFAHGGVLGASMLTPPPGSDSREFGILRTFANEKERDAFYESPMFKAWEERAQNPDGRRAGVSPTARTRSVVSLPAHPAAAMENGDGDLLGVYPVSLLIGIVLSGHAEDITTGR